MKITFGMALEGVRPLGREPSFNRLTCGVQGLTRVLELRLGLASPEISDAQRILAYRAALLRTAKTEDRFFSRSLKCDEFATAETLLRWRGSSRSTGEVSRRRNLTGNAQDQTKGWRLAAAPVRGRSLELED